MELQTEVLTFKWFNENERNIVGNAVDDI